MVTWCYLISMCNWLVIFDFLENDLLLYLIQGELPFQPFAGTRKDRNMMKRILETKPAGCISGI